MSDDSIKNACEQRKFSLLYNIPLVRNELISPYPQYTSAQLNMRRKVEVLKYAKQSTQSRSLTKKEKQAQILRGKYRGNTLFCQTDYTIPYSTSASDVPGPIIDLVEDKTVPLHNYLPNRFANATEVTENQEEWSLYTQSNVTCTSGLDNITNIATLLIRRAIKQDTYTYVYIYPIVFTITGIDIPIDTAGIIINIDINNISSKIYYGDNEIAENTTVTTFDTNGFSITLEPDSNITDDTYNYSASLFVGYMTMSNMYLNTSAGFSYNIGITYNASESIDYSQIAEDTSLDISTDTTTILSNTSFSLTSNVEDDYNIASASNCTINTSESFVDKITTFTGV